MKIQSGHKVVITAAASGIGRSCAVEFARLGMKLYVITPNLNMVASNSSLENTLKKPRPFDSPLRKRRGVRGEVGTKFSCVEPGQAP